MWFGPLERWTAIVDELRHTQPFGFSLAYPGGWHQCVQHALVNWSGDQFNEERTICSLDQKNSDYGTKISTFLRQFTS